MMKVKRTRIELYHVIMEMVRGQDMGQIKRTLAERYRVDSFQKMSLEQTEDFIEHFQGEKNAAPSLPRDRD